MNFSDIPMTPKQVRHIKIGIPPKHGFADAPLTPQQVRNIKIGIPPKHGFADVPLTPQQVRNIKIGIPPKHGFADAPLTPQQVRNIKIGVPPKHSFSGLGEELLPLPACEAFYPISYFQQLEIDPSQVPPSYYLYEVPYSSFYVQKPWDCGDAVRRIKEELNYKIDEAENIEDTPYPTYQYITPEGLLDPEIRTALRDAYDAQKGNFFEGLGQLAVAQNSWLMPLIIGIILYFLIK